MISSRIPTGCITLSVILLVAAPVATAQSIIWQDSFVAGVSTTPTQCADWATFAGQLTPGLPYQSVTISGSADPAGLTCSDPALTAQYASFINLGMSGEFTFNGFIWHYCDRGSWFEVWIDPPAPCSGADCPSPGRIIRPCIANSNFGGITTATCGPPSQTMKLEFVIGGLSIVSVTAGSSQVAPGETGVAVSMEILNSSANTVDVTAAGLSFADAMANDVASEYTVVANPANPSSLNSGQMATFDFSVDVDTMPTLGTIDLDGTVDGTDRVTMAMLSDSDADTPDSWDVIGAIPLVRTVTAVDPTVAQGGTGYRVDVAVENTGLTAITVGGTTFSFTGTMDRTGEYMVATVPGSPASIAAGGTETLQYTVDVDAMATVETITIDASFAGTDSVTGTAVSDPDADTTDMWDVTRCLATLCGDCTGDGMITILDALQAAQHSAGLITLTGTDFTNCNVTGVVEPDPGAAVGILDALTIAQESVGLPVTLVCC